MKHLIPPFRNLFSFSSQEVSSAFEHAKLSRRFLGLRVLTAPDSQSLPHGRLLIITPRKVGKAHERNLLRRRLKSIYFENQLYAKPGITIVIAYPDAVQHDFDTLRNFLVKTLSQLH